MEHAPARVSETSGSRGMFRPGHGGGAAGPIERKDLLTLMP
jgi:hypothetical protein